MTRPAHRRLDLPRLLDGGLLAAGAGYFLQLLLTGELGNYVDLRFAWVAWIGLFGFAALALAMVEEPDDASCGCGSEPSHWQRWALAVPVVFGLALPSGPLDSSVINRGPDVQAMIREHVDMRTLLTPETVPSRKTLSGLYETVFPEQPPNLQGTERFTLIDWLRVFVDLPDSERPALSGLPADLVGFVYRGDGDSGDRFTLARFFMRHCLFDTIPIGLQVLAEDGDRFPEDAWVRVRGITAFAPDASGREVLTVVADEVIRVEQPETPYLLPGKP